MSPGRTGPLISTLPGHMGLAMSSLKTSSGKLQPVRLASFGIIQGCHDIHLSGHSPSSLDPAVAGVRPPACATRQCEHGVRPLNGPLHEGDRCFEILLVRGSSKPIASATEPAVSSLIKRVVEVALSSSGATLK